MKFIVKLIININRLVYTSLFFCLYTDKNTNINKITIDNIN